MMTSYLLFTSFINGVEAFRHWKEVFMDGYNVDFVEK